MFKKFMFAGVLATVCLPLVTACGSESATTVGTIVGTTVGVTPAAGDIQEIKVTAKDNMFDPKSYTAVAGKPLRITAVNEGQNVHEVEVKGLMSETKLLPGQTKTVAIQTLTAGTYKVYCEIHEDSGMEGELVVK